MENVTFNIVVEAVQSTHTNIDTPSGLKTLIQTNNIFEQDEQTVFLIQYNTMGGTRVNTSVITPNITSIKLPSVGGLDVEWYTKVGNNVYGAFVGESGGTYSTANMSANVQLYARYGETDIVVLFEDNILSSGTLPDTQYITYASSGLETLTVGAKLTRLGYDYTGWTDGTHTFPLNGTTISVNRNIANAGSAIVLTPNWQVVTYTATFRANGGDLTSEYKELTQDNEYAYILTDNANKVYEYAYTVETPFSFPEVFKQGGAFQGWKISTQTNANKWRVEDCYTAGVLDNGYTGNVTFVAQWGDLVLESITPATAHPEESNAYFSAYDINKQIVLTMINTTGILPTYGSINQNVATITESNLNSCVISVVGVGRTTITAKVRQMGVESIASYGLIIEPKSIASVNLATISSQEYTGSPIEPSPVVTVGLTNLVENTDYTVSYSIDHTNVGTVTATITGIGNYNSTNTTTFDITAKAVTITASNQTITYGESIVNNTTKISSSGLVTGHSVSEIILTPSTNNVPGGTIMPSGATIKDGEDNTVTSNYNVSYVAGTLTINKATNPMTFELAQSISGIYNTSAINISFTGATNTQGNVTYNIQSQKLSGNDVVNFNLPDNTVPSLQAVASTSAGSYTVIVSASVVGTSNYNSKTMDKTLTVIIQPSVVTIATIGNYATNAVNKSYVQKVYDGNDTATVTKDVQYSVTATGAVPTSQLSVSAKYANANASDTNNVIITGTLSDTANYTFTGGANSCVINGKITKANATVGTAPTNKTELIYNGGAQELVNAGSCTNGTMYYALKVGDENYGNWSTSIPTGTNAGTYRVKYYVLGNANYNSTNAVEHASMTIGQRAITITGASSSRPYNGSALTNNSSSLTSGTLADGDTGAYTATGTITNVGSENNVPNVIVTRNSTDVTSNYVITKVNGTLTVTGVAIGGTIGQNGTLTYNGSNQTPTIANNLTSTNSQAITVKYCTTSNGTFDTSIPTYKDAGNYTLYYKATAPNHNEKLGSFAITVNKATIDATVTGGKWTFNGSAHYPVAKLNTAIVASGTAIIQYGITIDYGSSLILTTSEQNLNAVSVTNYNDNATTVYYKITSENYEDKIGSATIQVNNKADNPISVTASQSWNPTYSTSSQNTNFTGASNAQGDVTYVITSQKQGNTNVNYFSIGTANTANITMLANTPVNTYNVVITATAQGNSNYNGGLKTITLTVTIGKQTVNPVTGLVVSTAGIVTWSASSNSTGYQISIDNSNWSDATSGIDYKSTITSSSANKTVYVRAINSDSSNYTTPSINTTTTVTIYTVTLTKGTGISTVNGAGNYISGATVNINATVGTGYTWSKWTPTNGGADVSTTNEYCETISGNWSYTANATANRYQLYLQYNGGNCEIFFSDETSVSSYPGDTYSVVYAEYNSSRLYKSYTGSIYVTSIIANKSGGYNFMGFSASSSGDTTIIKTDATLAENVGVYTGANGGWIRDGSLTLFAKYIMVAERITIYTNGHSISYKYVNWINQQFAVESTITSTEDSDDGWYVIYGENTIAKSGVRYRYGKLLEIGSNSSGYTLLGLYIANNSLEENKIIGSDGRFIPNVSGYTDSMGHWINEDGATLYARWVANS